MFYDPGGGIYRGRDEIDRIAGAIRATRPDFQYQPIAEPEGGMFRGRPSCLACRSGRGSYPLENNDGLFAPLNSYRKSSLQPFSVVGYDLAKLAKGCCKSRVGNP
jgi:hypothetical protein